MALPPPSMTKRLEELSQTELEWWLASINLSQLASKLMKHGVTAEVLSLCRREEELVEYNVSICHARLLLSRIEEVRRAGIELSAIAAPPARRPETQYTRAPAPLSGTHLSYPPPLVLPGILHFEVVIKGDLVVGLIN